MFGWEFPPHISGGLGTACFGLTKALTKVNTQIQFVIPKADGKPSGGFVKIINASNIKVSLEPEKGPILPEESVLLTGTKEIHKGITNMITMVVRSGIMPYTTQAVLSFGESSLSSTDIEKWNYQFPTNLHIKKDGKPWLQYQFSGGYGLNLLEEVKQYAITGGEIARQRNFDIIHVHDWLTFGAGIAAKKVSGKPLVVQVHSTEFDRKGKNIDERIFDMEREGMEAADMVITVSQWTKNIVTSKYHIPESKVQVVHNGVISKKQNKAWLRPTIGKKVITYLGRITYQKGPQYFVDAAARVLTRFPDVHFVMAGSGDQLPKMIERAAKLKISAHLHFTGFLKGEQVDRIWSVSNAYVMPSVSEPFGISPLEAAQAGVPVIISKQSGVAEVVEHAIKIDFWNVEALADAICNLLTHESLTKTLKRKSEKEISSITWDRAAKKINKLYHELNAKSKDAIPESVLSGSSTQAIRSI